MPPRLQDSKKDSENNCHQGSKAPRTIQKKNATKAPRLQEKQISALVATLSNTSLRKISTKNAL